MDLSRFPTLERRLLANVTVTDAGCWQWTRYIMPNGYAQISFGPREAGRDYIHRVAHMLYIGDIPDGLVIDHLCRNRACCNPEHLEAVPQIVNVARGEGHGSETHCPEGHAYDDKNTKRRVCGRRACRECERARDRRRRPRKVAA